MLYRSADGSGDVSFTGVQLTWFYGLNIFTDDAVVDVEVYAIEMVFVPEGPFYLGTGRSTNTSNNNDEEFNEFYTQSLIGQRDIFFEVQSEAEITIADGVATLYYYDDGFFGGDQSGPIPAAFPKGFASFYCMKYELTEAQWVAFFNTLTAAQRTNMDITDASGKDSDEIAYGNTVAWFGTGPATTTAPDRAMAYTTIYQNLAYLDWAALRPLTELEYEKAGRGPVIPVNKEYAWGTSEIYSGGPYVPNNDGTADERITNPGVGVGNAHYFIDISLQRPLRSGIFAASAVNPTRVETGGTFYGIMEWSGNLWERTITVGDATGRSFTGNHGDGRLQINGRSNEPSWPDGGTGLGYGFRGGSFISPSFQLRISNRNLASRAFNLASEVTGIRGVRTAQ